MEESNMNSHLTPGQKAAQTRKTNQASKVRMIAAKIEALRVWNTGCCPQCGAGLRQNLSITGWIQCDQYGAEGFRKDSTKAACSFQGFTE